MADESSSIALQLTINLRGLVKLTQLNNTLRELKTNALGFQRSLKTGNDLLKTQSDVAARAAKSLKDLNKANATAAKKIPKAPDAAANTNKVMAKQFADLQKMQAREQEKAEKARLATTQRAASQRTAVIRAESARFAAEMRRRQNDYANMVRAQMTLQGRLQRAEEQYDAIFRAGFRLQMVGRDIMQVGKAAIGTLQGMADEFGKFEFMVNRAAGAMGIATDELDGQVNLYDRFQVSIQNAARELKLFDPTDVAKATYYWASTSGQQIDNLGQLEQAMKAVNPLMKIAAMTETDYETAIKGVYSILVQYNLGLDQVQQVTEKLHTVTQLTAAEFPDLINSFKMVGPVARANNVTFDDMVVLLGRLADAGIRGTMSGRALRQLFIQLNKPSAIASASLDKLWKSTQAFAGKSYTEMVFPKGEFIGVTKYVDLLATATAHLNTNQRNALLAQITTANELPVLTALVMKAREAQMGLADQTQKTGNLGEEAAERFRKSWDLLSKSWLGVVGGFQRGAEIIRIQIGRRIAEVFKPALIILTDYLDRVSNWVDDPRNAAVIDFFVRLTGFTAGILAAAGAVVVFVGAMTSLAAAIAVGVRAFGPLMGRFAAISGVLGGIFSALIRNYDYIRKTAEEVFQNLADALGTSTDKVDGLSSAFAAFSAMTAPIFDVLIRTVGQFILLLSQLAKAVSQNEGMMAALSVVAQALGVILSVKILKTMLGLVNVSRALSGPLALVVKLFGSMIVPANAFVGVLGTAPTRIDRVKKSLSGLASAIGPGGALSLAIVGFTLAYETNFLGFKDFVDDVFTSIDTRIQQTVDRIDEARKAAGGYSVDLDKVAMSSPDIRSKQELARSIQQEIDTVSEKVSFSKGLNQKLKQVKLDIQMMTEDIYNHVSGMVDQINALGGQIDVPTFMLRVRQGMEQYGQSFEEATNSANKFFRTQITEMRKFDSQASRIMADLGRGTTRTGGPDETSNINDAIKATMKSQLVELRSKTSPEVQQQISDILNGAVLAGVALDEDEQGDLAGATKRTFGEISSTLLDAAEGFMNIDNKLSEIMKKAFTPSRQVQSVFKSYMKGWIGKGFRDSDGHFHVEAALFAQQSLEDLRTQFQTYSENLPAGEFTKYVNKTIKNFKTDFKNGLPKAVTPEMATALYNFIADVYATAGKPIPPAYIKMFQERGATIPAEIIAGAMAQLPTVNTAGENIPKEFGKGMKGKKAAVTTAVTAVLAGVKAMNSYTDNSWTWGWHLGNNFADGIEAARKAVSDAAYLLGAAVAKILKHSVPSEGPLSDDDKWGHHLVDNITDGIYAKIPEAARASSQLAAAISRGYEFANDSIGNGGVSIESNASRVIKVQVEVTSPDGSVSRIQAAQFERAMMSNDLIQSIEHMATVG